MGLQIQIVTSSRLSVVLSPCQLCTSIYIENFTFHLHQCPTHIFTLLHSSNNLQGKTGLFIAEYYFILQYIVNASPGRHWSCTQFKALMNGVAGAQILLCTTLAFPLFHRYFHLGVGSSTSSVQSHPAHFPGALLVHTGFGSFHLQCRLLGSSTHFFPVASPAHNSYLGNKQRN